MYLVLWAITNARGYQGSEIKYVPLLGYVAIGAVIVYMQYSRGRRAFEAMYLLQQVLICAIVWTFISVAAMLFNGFEGPYLKDLFFIVTPALFVFIMANTDPEPNLDFYYGAQVVALLASFLMMDAGNLNMSSIMAISFSDSVSPFEADASNTWSLIFMYYYVKKKPMMSLLCAVMCYLTLKRLNVVFVLVVLIFGWALRRFRATDTLIHLCMLIFIVSPVLINYFTSDAFVEWFDSTFEKSFYDLTSGRSQQLAEARDYPESKLGLGMVNKLLERHGHYVKILHSDLLRVYWETTFLGLVVLTVTFFNLVKINHNIYFLAVMGLAFLLLFASVNLAITENWLLIFMHAVYMGRESRQEAPDGALRAAAQAGG
jgi:hypothetical protein